MNSPEKPKVRKGGRVVLRMEGVRSMTKQSFASSVTVDSILKKYATLGVNPNDVGLFRQGVASMPYGISDTSLDYQQQFHRMKELEAYFKRLPSGIRERFGHSPAKLLDFMADPANKTECEELGLFVKPEKPKEKPPEKEAEKAKPPESEPKK